MLLKVFHARLNTIMMRTLLLLKLSTIHDRRIQKQILLRLIFEWRLFRNTFFFIKVNALLWVCNVMTWLVHHSPFLTHVIRDFYK